MRNLAIGGCLLGLVAIFYVATIVKIGPNMMKAQQSQGLSQCPPLSGKPMVVMPAL